MIDPEVPTRIDLRISCTKDEAVAKMLGWMQGFIRRDDIEVTEDGISEDQLPSTHTLFGSLEDQLEALRRKARQELMKAAESGDDLQKTYEAVVKYDELIKKAANFLMDIEDELDSGSSILIVDQEAKNKTGIIHIKLRSLDKWARSKYQIAILDDKGYEAGAAVAMEEISLEEKPAPPQKRSSITENRLYVTFAYLLDSFSTKGNTYRKADGTLNVDAIAQHLSGLASKANGNGKYQSVEAIKDRIEEAKKRKEVFIKEGE